MLGLSKSETNLLIVFIWGFYSGATIVQLDFQPLIKAIIFISLIVFIYLGFIRRKKLKNKECEVQ